ncbi:DUF6438 domain-containing protein [Sandarakinorhabdus oryzae]|uniref:DUF6438 domain-containing protein n=1 Tax=Sandarakinorhabdus oryzae TaxID=2675220 RepID=UPI0012E2B7D3|nr:DUF6438 domain-containing protein [Sandarakinorhabdus oryzae]
MNGIRPVGLALGLLLVGCDRPQPAVTQVGVADLASYRLSGPTEVAVTGWPPSASIQVSVLVGPDGRVRDAKAQPFGNSDVAPALAAARQWQFAPFMFDNHPVSAVGTIKIDYYPPAAPPPASAPSLPVFSKDVEIQLQRSACHGSCPDYSVTIHGDGRVIFESDGPVIGAANPLFRHYEGYDVLWPGRHVTRVDPAAVAQLYERFRAARFFGLTPSYRAPVTDLPTYALTLRTGGKYRTVYDYGGEMVGMPTVVTELEDAVDALADTDRWIEGTAGTPALLRAEGARLPSDWPVQLAMTVLAKAEMDQYDKGLTLKRSGLFTTLLQQGLDRRALVRQTVRPPREVDAKVEVQPLLPLGAVLAEYAVVTGDEALLAAIGPEWLRRLPVDERDALLQNGFGCQPATMAALEAAGARLVGKETTALHALAGRNPACGPPGPIADKARLQMLRRLLASGIAADVRDGEGRTPLMLSQDPQTTALLLAAGANPRARSKDGLPAILYMQDDRSAVMLLRAGADPLARDREGKSLLESRADQPMPATRAWLAEHAARPGARQ